MRLTLVILLSILVALAGCADDSKDGTDPGDGDRSKDAANNTTAGPQVVTGTGSITASAGIVSFGSEVLSVPVRAGARVLFAEIAWDDAVEDIDLALASPSSGSAAGETNFDHTAPGGMPGSPDSPHTLTIPAPEEGTWGAGASANGASGTVEYRLAVTVFYDTGDVPAGYSAL